MKKIIQSIANSFAQEKSIKEVILHSGLFNFEWYGSKYPEAIDENTDLLEHFITTGDLKGYKPNPYFDPDWYRSQAPGARKSGVNSLAQYITFGSKRGKNPSRLFSSKLYFTAYPEAEKYEGSALEHFLKLGIHKGYIAFPTTLQSKKDGKKIMRDMIAIQNSGLFLEDWYRHYYASVWNYEGTSLFHFVSEGHKNNLWPNPIFNTGWYKVFNKEHMVDENPLLHYIDAPKNKFDPAPDFSNQAYFTRYSDLNPETDDPLQHFIKNGMQSGKKKPASNRGKVRSKAKLPVPERLRGMVDYSKTSLNPESLEFKSNKLKIHWVIPDFAAGSGGHMTIFRMASYLEKQGHNQVIWINAPSIHTSEEKAAENILKHFQQFTGKVKFLDKRFKRRKAM